MIARGVVRHEFSTQLRRYVLVSLSMLLGVVGTVAIALANSVAAEMLVAQQEQLNGREATFEAPLAEYPRDDAGASLVALLDELDATTGPSVAVHLEATVPMSLSRDPDAPPAGGVQVTSSWTIGATVDEIRRMPVIEGSMPPASCYPAAVALNEEAAARLGAGPGTLIHRIGDNGAALPLAVSGIVADGNAEAQAYGAWESLACADEPLLLAAQLTVRAHADPGAQPVLDEVLRQAAPRHRVAEAGFHRLDTVEQVREQVATLTLLFGVSSALLLTVATLGIANVGIASVAERARELVVRRAFGATRLDVFAQVLTGAALIGTVVSALAILLAVIGTYVLVPALIPAASSISPPVFPWLACAAGVVAAMATSLLGSLVPAVAATRLPIARALRG
ncbi:ABC transporter permease [Homoserinibacter sp. GY 40078]|uniref:ABC transporter permease n=1 Tax=Homoserinibacter sp. GY 40078 TaxID=2603275 RepID=UPI0011C8F8C5|nr:ABC transporter permease [Homoserinibacter sp. GY 40078]TXK16365.1 ABC transporter permease [Homoserinibacter sp. GY 40078]